MSAAREMSDDSASVVPTDSSERFICRLAGGEFFWSYYDERGRLLVNGPPHAEQWEAHRLLLAAIQHEATSGSLLLAAEELQEELQEETDDARQNASANGTPEP